MLAATLMGGNGAHVHAQSLRPDRIIATGVIEPYPMRSGFDPTELARKILEPFTQLGGPPMPTAPAYVNPDPDPKAMVEQARNYAIAFRQGIKPPPYLPAQMYQIMNALIAGQPFTVTSQGSTLTVEPTQDLTRVGLSGGGGPGARVVPLQLLGGR